MGYRISKQNSIGCSSYFLLYGRHPLFPSRFQHLEEEELYDKVGKLNQFQLELNHRGAILQQVMPLARSRNQAIAQHHDKEIFRHVRGGGYVRPKAKFVVGEFVMLKQSNFTLCNHRFAHTFSELWS